MVRLLLGSILGPLARGVDLTDRLPVRSSRPRVLSMLALMYHDHPEIRAVAHSLGVEAAGYGAEQPTQDIYL